MTSIKTMTLSLVALIVIISGCSSRITTILYGASDAVVLEIDEGGLSNTLVGFGFYMSDIDGSYYGRTGVAHIAPGPHSIDIAWHLVKAKEKYGRLTFNMNALEGQTYRIKGRAGLVNRRTEGGGLEKAYRVQFLVFDQNDGLVDIEIVKRCKNDLPIYSSTHCEGS